MLAMYNSHAVTVLSTKVFDYRGFSLLKCHMSENEMLETAFNAVLPGAL